MNPLLFFLLILAFAASPAAIHGSTTPDTVRENQYFLESLRLTRMAQESYDYGDYDASAGYAAEAIRYTQLSDEYVALRLAIKAADDAIAAARGRLQWAASIGAPARYPQEFVHAQDAYDEALEHKLEQRWDQALDAARRAMGFLAELRTGTELLSRYVVRPWKTSGDCLWNIAGRPWAYGDPAKWRLLYEANKARLPEPDNPDLIHPGMVLDIPSINGEIRSAGTGSAPQP